MRKIPFYIPPISIGEYIQVFKTLRTRWLTTGEKNQILRRKISEYLSIDESKLFLVSSCSGGIHLLLDAFEVRGKEVIIPSITFISSVEMAIHTGAKPIIVDVDNFITISVEDTEKKITKNTKCIIPIYYAGNSYDVEGIKRIAKDNGILVIEDAAHAFGTEIDHIKVGNTEKLGTDAAVFSFYSTKNIQTGEGGLISTHHQHIIEKISKTYLHGMDKDAWKRYHSYMPTYDITEVGFKYNLPDILAAIGIAQIKKFKKLQRKREKIAEKYREYLSDIEGISAIETRKNTKHSNHLFVIRVKKDMWKITRDEFIKILYEKGISTSIHFTPVYRFTKYKQLLNLDPKNYPNSEKIFSEIVSLPIYPDLKQKHLEYICSVIKDTWKKFRR